MKNISKKSIMGLLYLVVIGFVLLNSSIFANSIKISNISENSDSLIMDTMEDGDNEKDDTNITNETQNDDHNGEDLKDEEDNNDDNDEDNDGIDDEIESRNERELQIEEQSNQIEIESTLKNGQNKNSFQIHIEYNSDGIKLELQYESEVESEAESEAESGDKLPDSAQTGESELQLTLKLTSIIEFIDSNNDGLFDTENDSVVQKYALDNFKQATVVSKNINGTIVYEFNISTTDDVFGMHFVIAEEFLNLTNRVLTPTQMKIDFIIDHFGFKSNESLLALETKVQSEFEYEETDETEDEKDGFSTDDEEALEFQSNSNGVTGVFAWSKQANVDGILKDVLSTNIIKEDGSEIDEKFYLIYPHGDYIVHDPTFGVGGVVQLSIGSLNIPGPLWSLILFSFVCVVGLIVVIKKRNAILR